MMVSTESSLFLSVLLFLCLINNTLSFEEKRQTNLRLHLHQHQQLDSDRALQETIPRPPCIGVLTEEHLILAIANRTTCNSVQIIPTNINICADIKLTSLSVPFVGRTTSGGLIESFDSSGTNIGLSKFNISCKNFAFTCGKPGGLSRCVIDGRALGASRIFYGINSKFSSQRIIFMNGGGVLTPTTKSSESPSPSTAVRFGGALYFERSIITLRDTTFGDNVASDSGGAIFVRDSDLVIMSNATGSVTASSSFVKNSAGKYGGAIAIDTISKIIAQVGTIRFRSNMASYAGGAISIFDNYTNTTNTGITNIRTHGCAQFGGLTFESNTALIGGAIYGLNLTNTKNSNIRNCSFRNNTGQLSNPSIYFTNPALYIQHIVDAVMTNNTFDSSPL